MAMEVVESRAHSSSKSRIPRAYLVQKRPYKTRCDCSAVPSWAGDMFVPSSPFMSPLLRLRLSRATAMSTGSSEADGAWIQIFLRIYPCRSPRHCIRFHFRDQRVSAATLIGNNTESMATCHR